MTKEELKKQAKSKWAKTYYEKNKEKVKAKSSEYYEKNKDSCKERMSSYVKKNREKINIYKNEWEKRKKLADSKYWLIRTIRRSIGDSIRNMGYTKKTRTAVYLGCDYETFASHLESQFKDGMSWDNRGEWEIDHIIPVASAKAEDDVFRLNHYTNLQPLWSTENRQKSDKMPCAKIKNKSDLDYAKAKKIKLTQLSLF
jgi:hypothetical protein